MARHEDSSESEDSGSSSDDHSSSGSSDSSSLNESSSQDSEDSFQDNENFQTQDKKTVNESFKPQIVTENELSSSGSSDNNDADSKSSESEPEEVSKSEENQVEDVRKRPALSLSDSDTENEDDENNAKRMKLQPETEMNEVDTNLSISVETDEKEMNSQIELPTDKEDENIDGEEKNCEENDKVEEQKPKSPEIEKVNLENEPESKPEEHLEEGENDDENDNGVEGEMTFVESLNMLDVDDVRSSESDFEDSRIESAFSDINNTENLRHFDVLDDLDRHSNQEGSDSDDCSNDTNSDIPDEEVEAMLEAGLPDEFKKKRPGKDPNLLYEEREKLVLDEIGHNHFDVLPEGWVQVTHNSGMPLYLHRQSRVCTLSKPYFLGPGSVRKHEVPVSAVPCLQYKRALKEECEEAKREKEKKAQAGQGVNLPNAKIETIQENRVTQSLDGESIRNYCKSLFRFKSIKVMRFRSWSQRRKFTKSKKQKKQLERPTLPDGTKLITFPVMQNPVKNYGTPTPENDSLHSRPPKHWIMNPSGKSYVCILHEYVQHALKKQPTYKFKELENAATPYSAVVCINEMEYGSGFGSSKKQAKADAAKKTLEILIPQMRDKITNEILDENLPASSQNSKASKVTSDADLSFFDQISITDPRVAEFCAKTTEPLPHAILITCLQRNFGLGDMHINYSVNTLKHQRNEFTMQVGKHRATVICRNKKDGKQRAAQSILQLLHPHITSWGSLLRLYGSRSVKSFKEKKQLEQEITLLQGKAAINQPNHAILEKLRQEMRKLAEQRQAVKPIGKFVPPDLPTGSSSNLDNVDL